MTVGLVLLTACANVANLVLTETAILAAAGAALVLAIAYAGLDVLVSLAERFTPRAGEIRMDGGVLAFALLAATGSALVFAGSTRWIPACGWRTP